MNKHPSVQHQDHHLSVRATLWKTYIVCEECGEEYETAWSKLYQRLSRPIHGLLSVLFVWLVLFFGGIPSTTNWWHILLYAAGYASFITLGHIGLNALQAFLLRRSDDLASHIF